MTSKQPACLIPSALQIQHDKGKQLGGQVNKAELIDEIAKHADISKKKAGEALDAVFEAVITTLKNDGSVTLVGFGTFSVGKRASRVGSHPRTKTPIEIEAARVPKFKAGKAFKDALN